MDLVSYIVSYLRWVGDEVRVGNINGHVRGRGDADVVPRDEEYLPR